MSDTEGNKEIVIHKEVSSTSQFRCPVLTSTNYTMWAIHVKTILRANGLWEMIEPKENTQPDEKKDMTTIVYLFQALPVDMILQVANCESAKEIWDALRTRHVGVDRVQKARLQTLRTEFEMLKMKEEDTIDSFTAKLNSIVTRAKGLGSTYDEPMLVRKVLSSMPKRFVQIVATIEQFADLETTTLDETIGRLKAYEERTNLMDGGSVDNQDKLLFTRQDKNYGRWRGFGNQGQGRFKSSQGKWRDGKLRQEDEEEDLSQDSCKNKSIQKKFVKDLSKIKCYNCQKFGHYASDCPKQNQRGEQSNLVQEDEEPTLLMAMAIEDHQEFQEIQDDGA